MQKRHRQDQPNKDQKPDKTQRQNKRKQHIVAGILLLICLFVMLAFAWFYYQTHRRTLSDARDVMPPYCLYLVDPNGTDSLQLTVGNLHPGEKKQVVVGVSNRNPEDGSESSFQISRDSSFHYELELAYTQNLPVSYTVYALQQTDGTQTDDDAVTVEWTGQDGQSVSRQFTRTKLTKTAQSDLISAANNNEMYGEQADQVVNQAQYDLYDNTSGSEFDLTAKVEDDGVQFDLDYYMIEITWDDDISFADYLKETDLVYVMVKALQLEPQ